DRKSRRQLREDSPSLLQERHAARRESRRPDDVDCVRALFVCEPRSSDREEIVVDNFKKIARSEAIRRRQDIGLAPANELLAGFESDGAAVVERTQPPDFRERPLQLAIAP